MAKNIQISCFMEEKEANLIKRLAKEDRRTISDFVRLKLLDSIKKGKNV